MHPEVAAACQRVLEALQIYVQLGDTDEKRDSCVATLELIAIELEGITDGEWEDGP